MVQTGLLYKIFLAVADIYYGRNGFVTDGLEREGRIHYQSGIAASLSAFQEAQLAGDLKTLMLTELTFQQQEFQFCNEADTFALSSLTQAIQSFKEALLSLEAVEDAGYKIADKTYPQSTKYRVKDYPKDAFHLACIAHRTRLQNVLRSPGINMTEKAVLQQRIANLVTAQSNYVEKQKKILNAAL